MREWSRFKAAGATACLIAAAAWQSTDAAVAQIAPPPSQVAPPVVPPSVSAPTRIILPRVEAGATIPPGAKALTFKLTGITIEGEFEELAAERKRFAAQLVGKRISVAQVFDFATALQAVYSRSGYPLVRVVVPPQELGAAAGVKVTIIDGFVEQIDASNIAEPGRKAVVAVVSSLIDKRHLTQAELERRLLLAGETPGIVLNAVFSAGKQVGGAVLVLAGTYKPVSASVYADNAMPSVFGTGQVVASASLNSVFGMGEQITVSAAGLPDSDYTSAFPTRRYLSATFATPLGTDGWKFDGGFTRGITTPQAASLLTASQGFLTQGYGRLSYAALKRRDAELTFSVRFDSTDEEIESLLFSPALPLSLDRVRTVRGSVEGLWRLRESGTVIGYGATLSRGLDAFGARTAADATPLLPLSRAGADAVFSKLAGHFELTQSLPAGFFVAAFANGQTSFDKPLLHSEQFDLVGARMLSGYSAGSFIGDTGWVVRTEFGHPFAVPNVTAEVTPYLFAATGERILAQPSILEVASQHASNWGAGVRFSMPQTAAMPVDVFGFLEGARKVTDDPFQQPGWRVFTGLSLRY